MRRQEAEKPHWTVLTRKGQITVPVEVRRALGLKQGDKVAVLLGQGQARLVRAGDVVARTAGMLKTGEPSASAGQLRDRAEEAVADESVERNG